MRNRKGAESGLGHECRNHDWVIRGKRKGGQDFDDCDGADGDDVDDGDDEHTWKSHL